MPKPNRNGCKNTKQTNLLVEGARSGVQKSQITVERKKLSANTKVGLSPIAVFRFSACFKQGVPWHSGEYRV